jgi:hypothetical protein
MRKTSVILCCAMIPMLCSCATYRATLANEKGETVECNVDGKFGPVTSYYAQRKFDTCIVNANRNGYTNWVYESKN